MFQLINTFSASSKDAAQAMGTCANNAQAAADAAAFVSVHTLNRAAKRYFGSKMFLEHFKKFQEQRLAAEYGSIIAARKAAANAAQKWQLAEAIVYVDIYDLLYDGQMWDYQSLADTCKGYKSQALREAKVSQKSFNAAVYYAVAKILSDKREIRALLKSLNSQVLRERAHI